MQPVITVEEMRKADAAALAHVEEAVLVRRAGTAVAVRALEMLGGAYGRRVVVVAGKGNNGNDGRVAAQHLRQRGARVTVLPADSCSGLTLGADLVIDAAYGTGFRGSYVAPDVASDVPVLAVDIPSGVDGNTGEASGRPMAARSTITFASYKPGLLQWDGADLCGSILVSDIGVTVNEPSMGLIDDDDVAAFVPAREHDAHKWKTSVAVVAGSPGMEGAAALCVLGASRSGAGMVRLAVPGSRRPDGGVLPGPWPLQAVRVPLGEHGWAEEVLEILQRCKALVVGPGLGRGDDAGTEIRRLVSSSPVPVVVDADALVALGGAESARKVVKGERGVERPVVLTPHDGEFRGLDGSDPGSDRVAAARRLAERTGAIVLLKGAPTVVAAPPGDLRDLSLPGVLLSTSGTSRLATAGTGDVLSGVVGAFIARGTPPVAAAAVGAHVHGRAGELGLAEGLVAGDLPDLVARVLSELLDPEVPTPEPPMFAGPSNV